MQPWRRMLMAVCNDTMGHFEFVLHHGSMRADRVADEKGGGERKILTAPGATLAPLPAGSIVGWVGNLIHWGTCCLPDSKEPLPRTAVGFNFLRAGERLQSGAPSLSREDARRLSLDGRLALIARSVLAYSPWYALEDDAVPREFFPVDTTAVFVE